MTRRYLLTPRDRDATVVTIEADELRFSPDGTSVVFIADASLIAIAPLSSVLHVREDPRG